MVYRYRGRPIEKAVVVRGSGLIGTFRYYPLDTNYISIGTCQIDWLAVMSSIHRSFDFSIGRQWSVCLFVTQRVVSRNGYRCL